MRDDFVMQTERFHYVAASFMNMYTIVPISGRAGCLMYWWVVNVSRGERRHLHLTFDNPGEI